MELEAEREREEASDEGLIRAVREGETERYEALIGRYQQRLYIYCYHLLMQREEAEDAVQEVFIKGYEKLSQFVYNQSFAAWLYKIAYHHCLNVLRKRRRTALLSKLLKPLGHEGADDGYAEARRKEVAAQSELALGRLTVVERSLIVLRVIEGKSYEEIGQSFPQSPAALRKKVERAKLKLKRIWMELEGDADGEATKYAMARESERIGRAIAPD
ncbi:RNA polymerase sigma factor [Paenibacillus agaridevorans]|uniref:RNA polymerase sigma factor n=1 Tax=Paenibacillus agaridevorans TaxID=171404 RepID=UPI001BE474A6|nr:RNA polymerase sigma factor [Paenibacillus agaridevorans]